MAIPNTFVNGAVADADEVNANFNYIETFATEEVENIAGKLFTDVAQNIFANDYNGFDARLGGDGVPQYNNVFYDTFQTDSADEVALLSYDSTLDKYDAVVLSSTEPYIVIEADNATVAWTSNDTSLIKISSGVWILYGTAGTDEVKRAQLHKSLWYGTTGSNQLIEDFTNVTAMKTNVTRDVGKRATYVTGSWSSTGVVGQYTGTFANTTTNTSMSSWSRVQNTTSYTNKFAAWNVPAYSALNKVISSSSVSDELGTDKTADEKSNPASCQIELFPSSDTSNINVQAIVLGVGAITWAQSGLSFTTTKKDFFTDNSIPDFTAASGTELSTGILIMKESLSETVTNAIPVFNYFSPVVVTGVFTNGGFEDAITTEWTYSETDSDWSGARDTADPFEGTYCYKIVASNNITANAYGQILQTVDLTNATHLSCMGKGNVTNSDQMRHEIYVGDTLVAQRIFNSDDADYVEIIGEIPSANRTTNQDVKIRCTSGSPAQSSGAYLYMDRVRALTNETPAIISVSADGGTNWETVNNGELVNFTNTGTELWWKIQLVTPIASAYISETAIKYNI